MSERTQEETVVRLKGVDPAELQVKTEGDTVARDESTELANDIYQVVVENYPHLSCTGVAVDVSDIPADEAADMGGDR